MNTSHCTARAFLLTCQTPVPCCPGCGKRQAAPAGEERCTDFSLTIGQRYQSTSGMVRAAVSRGEEKGYTAGADDLAIFCTEGRGDLF